MVEAEVIPGPVMAEISARSGLVTVSPGSGDGADVMYLFVEDVCGEKEHAPRHARVYANLAALHRQIREERIAALTAYRADIDGGEFPSEKETARIDLQELDRFLERLEGSK